MVVQGGSCTVACATACARGQSGSRRPRSAARLERRRKAFAPLVVCACKEYELFGILAAGAWSGLQRIDLLPKKFQAALVRFLHAPLRKVVDYAVQLRLHALLLNTPTKTACQLRTVLYWGKALQAQNMSLTCFCRMDNRQRLTSLAAMEFMESSEVKSREKLSQKLLKRSACSAVVSWER